MNNIKDDRSLTETPARYPLLRAWPSSQPDSGSRLEGFRGEGERRGVVWRDVWGRSGGAAPDRGGQECCSQVSRLPAPICRGALFSRPQSSPPNSELYASMTS